MGLLDAVGKLFGGKMPQYQPRYYDEYWTKTGQGTKNTWAADQLGYEKLKEYMNRAPGYTADEQQAMYDVPAEQTKFDETAALRRLNQSSAAAGSYRSGGRVAGAGRILAEGSRTRSGLRQNVKIKAADAALQDRLRQLEAMNSYVLPRMDLRQGQIQMANEWGMNHNELAWQQRKWAADQLLDLIKTGVGAGVCWVAEALWGSRDPRTMAARFYFALMAPKAVRKLYQIAGPGVAQAIRRFPLLGAPLRPIFNAAAKRGAARLGELLP